jgi:hypothetical protein
MIAAYKKLDLGLLPLCRVGVTAMSCRLPFDAAGADPRLILASKQYGEPWSVMIMVEDTDPAVC